MVVHENRLLGTIPWVAFRNQEVALRIGQAGARDLDCRTCLASHLVVCWGIHLLGVLQDAPQHARRAMMTLHELRVEAQHVVEEHNVDGNMDEEEACGRDVEMDEGEEGTCKEEDLLDQTNRVGAAGAGNEAGRGVVGTLHPGDTGVDTNECAEVVAHDVPQWPDCRVPKANGVG